MSLLVEGVALTPSGRPVLAPEELELRMLERVDAEFGDKRAGNMRGGLPGKEADKYVAGVAMVTSHRLIWLDQARAPGTEGLSCSVHLSRVIEAAPVPLKMFGSRTRRTRMALRRGIVGPNDAGGALVLAFRGESPDAFTHAVTDALAKKAWLAEPQGGASSSRRGGQGGASSVSTRVQPSVPAGQPDPPPGPPPGSRSAFATDAGVGGVLHRQHQEHKQRQTQLGQAFVDMNALMAKAKEMVQLAEHLAAVERRRVTGSDESTGAETAETTEMDAMMLSMGIASPVTKETAGALYHQQLARQLGDWLPRILAKSGGILPLPDVFCLFNRARGSELISPEDLLKACQLWKRLGVPLQFRRFDSGIQVVQSMDRSDDEVCATLMEMINRPSESHDGEKQTSSSPSRMDTYSASVALGINPTIASEYLLMAERHGILCRDDGPEATYFYPNFFPECSYAAEAA